LRRRAMALRCRTDETARSGRKRGIGSGTDPMTVSADSFHQFPAVAAPDARAADMNFIVKIFTIEMVIVVITQKIAVPIGSAETSQVALALLIHAGVLGILFLRG